MNNNNENGELLFGYTDETGEFKELSAMPEVVNIEIEKDNSEDEKIIKKIKELSFNAFYIDDLLFKPNLNNNIYDVVTYVHSFPRGDKLPKKKRIRKKWLKKYSSKQTLKNVMLIHS